MARDLLREEEFESRWEAAPAVELIILIQLLLAFVSWQQDWQLWGLPWWVWLIPVGPEKRSWFRWRGIGRGVDSRRSATDGRWRSL